MNYSKIFDQDDPIIEEDLEIQTIEDDYEPYQAPTDKMGKVNARYVNVRRDMSTVDDPVEVVEKGDELLIIDENQDWYQVLTPKGTDGYIMSKYVDII